MPTCDALTVVFLVVGKACDVRDMNAEQLFGSIMAALVVDVPARCHYTT